MTKIKYLAFAFVLGFVAISCGEDDDTAPVVNITSPAASSTYAVTDTMQLTATVTEDTKLESVVLFSDLGLNQTIPTLDSDTAHAVNFFISFEEMTAAGMYDLTITATDEAGNVGTDVVSFIVE